MLIANATILVAGGAINRFAKFQLRRSLFDPEIRELAGHAQWSAKPCQNELPPTQLLIAVFATVFLSLIGTAPLVGSAAWFWRVPVGLAISEAIYLAWAFEGLLMKAELEAIARRWTRLQAARARTQAEPPAPTRLTLSPLADRRSEESSSAASESESDTGWILRARYLLTALRCRGLLSMQNTNVSVFPNLKTSVLG
jgi:hypothetical protein